jgi:conjugal transfer pilus assembly protein TraV
MNTKLITLVAALLPLAGCSTFSGLNGSSSTACKAPDGVTCQSISGVYANNISRNSGKESTEGLKKESARRGAERQQLTGFTQVGSGAPVMSPTQVIRVWFAPWKDRDNDMHDESTIYTVRTNGHWIIDNDYQANSEATGMKKANSINNLFQDDGMRKVSTTGRED